MSQVERLKILHSVVGKLPSGKAAFANDLMNNFRRFNRLSDKQMEWVEKLIVLASATAPGGESEPSSSTHTQHRQHIPGFKAVEDLLYKARQHIQFPCMRLRTAKGQKIILRPRTQTRAVKVQVAELDMRGDVSGEILDTSYLRFLPDLTDVLNTLYEVAAHPVETAVMYGKKTGNCCFCGLCLTDQRSVRAGYGPICAENYGLPWGEETKEEVMVDELKSMLEAQK